MLEKFFPSPEALSRLRGGIVGPSRWLCRRIFATVNSGLPTNCWRC